MAEGTPEQVSKEPRSYTGRYLNDVLAKVPDCSPGADVELSEGLEGPQGARTAGIALAPVSSGFCLVSQ